MRGKFTSALCGVIAASVLATPIDALAAPPSAPNQASLRLPDPAANVYYRRYYRGYPYRYGYRRGYRYGYAYDPSGAIFGAAALGIAAAGVAAATAPHYYYGYPGWGW